MTSSIVWENCRPIFVDIDPDTFNLNPFKIEDAITDRTSGIIVTHVFGIPCDVENIERIARKHRLKVICDAAHCFGTRYKGESIHKRGDIGITSFHATKLFQTIEGGGILPIPRSWRRKWAICEILVTMVLASSMESESMEKIRSFMQLWVYATWILSMK